MTDPAKQVLIVPGKIYNSLPLSHFLLALAVVIVWGTNFVVIRIALDYLPPLSFAALRFTFALLPAVFFLKRPDVPWWHLIAYGVLIGVGQFGLLYLAMGHEISPGLASLVVQTHVFFFLILAIWLESEPIVLMQLPALALALAGGVVIARQSDGDASILGLIMTLGAALSWACGNLVARRSGRINMLAYVVWASMFSVPPLIALSMWFEGPDRVLAGIEQASPGAWAAVLWQSAGNTMFGYAAWGWLLARHPAGRVVPLALAVPVFGMGASALILGESLPVWKLLAAGLILAGLALNLFVTAFAKPKEGA